MAENNISNSSLKTRSEFIKLRQDGKRKSLSFWLFVNYIIEDSQVGSIEFGMTISSKVGSSVVRNKMKRWFRNYFQNLSLNGKSLKINFILKPVGESFYKNLKYEEFKITLDKFIINI